VAKWVRLPDGAQVTLSNSDYEATQGLTLGTKIVLVFVILGAVLLFGHTGKSDTHKTPTNQPTHSAPAEVKGS
jgi:hypothetical protein